MLMLLFEFYNKMWKTKYMFSQRKGNATLCHCNAEKNIINQWQ